MAPISIGTGLTLGQRQRGGRRTPAAPPTLLRPPALLGDGRIGSEMAIDPGVWTGAARLGFVWLRNGAPIAGVDGRVYIPTRLDDRTALAGRVVAYDQTEHTSAETPAVTIIFPQPLAVGPIPDLIYTQGTGPHIVDISPFISGDALRFSISGDGVSVDPGTGVLTVPAETLLSGGAITVIAANSGGTAELSFRLTVTPDQVDATPPVLVAAPTLAGAGRVGEALAVDPGVWDGAPAPEFALQWLRDGAPVPGATAVDYTPGAAEDGAAVACRVTARNAAGTAVAETAAITIVQVAPAATGALDDVLLAQGGPAATLDAAAAFTGAALRFAVAGAGAGIDPATGIVTVPADAAGPAQTVTVTATNSGGAASVSFAVRVIAGPVALAAPEAARFAVAPGVRTIAAAAFFAGVDLGYSLDAAPAGVTIDAASGVVTIPTAAALDGVVTVRATNPAGAATQGFALRVLAAPAARPAPAPAVFLQGAGIRTVSAQAFFDGEDLAYALEGTPAGVTINPGSGLVTIPVAAALEQTIGVRATNAAGAATQGMATTVRASISVFDAAPALAALQFPFAATAPVWTSEAGGFGRLVPAASGAAHGVWSLAQGDGRYRCLARWGQAPGASRPFGFAGRLARTGADLRGVRVEAVQRGAARLLEIRQYVGAGDASITLARAAVAWVWDAWSWLEVEFDGAAVRARLHPETAAAPDWQVAAATSHVAPGGFGPAAFPDGARPTVDIRRLEFQPASRAIAALTPAAPQGGDWSLDQIMVQK